MTQRPLLDRLAELEDAMRQDHYRIFADDVKEARAELIRLQEIIDEKVWPGTTH